MYIHQVQRGTKFTFTFENGQEVEGVFDGNIDHLQYNIICQEISGQMDIFQESEPETQFQAGDSFYTFKSKLLGISEKKDAIHDSLEFKVITPFKETTQRSNFRIKIALRVRIHEYIDDFKKLYSDGWLFDAVSDDISKNGIRLFSDYATDAPQGTMFTLEFTLQSGVLYMIPAKLMRNQPNTATRSYNYDLGFTFDYSQMPDKQEKLILDILEYKIKHRL
ncbi:MAG: PilZ domain-containing protein [Defluviitaleaceae bacterium]|nr:PilZ domain-containing protein [Defluviitaleaceae bacterium]